MWKPVIFHGESFAGLYEAHPDGFIRLARNTHQSVKGHILSPALMNGYPALQLYRAQGGVKNRVNAQVHRIMLETFIGPPPTAKHQCNHKNGDKADSDISNLEWCTPSENQKHAHRYGLVDSAKGTRNARAKLTDEQVLEIRRLRSLSKPERPKQQDVAEQFGIARSLVSMIESRKIWTHLDLVYTV